MNCDKKSATSLEVALLYTFYFMYYISSKLTSVNLSGLMLGGSDDTAPESTTSDASGRE